MDNAIVRIAALPHRVKCKERFNVRFFLHNTGDTIWRDNLYYLGSREPRDNWIWGMARFSIANFLPGQSATMNMGCIAPSNPGNYIFAWQMVHEGVRWFGNVDSQTVQVVSANSNMPLPGPSPHANDLQSCTVFDTGPYPGGNGLQTMYWKNTSGRDIRIHKTYLWSGVQTNTIADVHLDLKRERDGSPMNLVQWDHYAEPTAPNNHKVFDYSPYWFYLANGERLMLRYFITKAGKLAHHVAIIYFTYI